MATFSRIMSSALWSALVVVLSVLGIAIEVATGEYDAWLVVFSSNFVIHAYLLWSRRV